MSSREQGGSITVTRRRAVAGRHRRDRPRARARVRAAAAGIEIEVKAGRARVEIELTAPIGAVLPELARDVQMNVTSALAAMCGLVVDAVDVTVAELVA